MILMKKEVQKTMGEKLIYSFELKPYCSSANNEEILSLGKWDGTSEGCKCKDKINDDECSEDDVKDGCQEIKSESPKEYKKLIQIIFVSKEKEKRIGN